jgi:hypothetical protein
LPWRNDGSARWGKSMFAIVLQNILALTQHRSARIMFPLSASVAVVVVSVLWLVFSVMPRRWRALAWLHPHHPLSAEAIRKLLIVADGPYVTLGPIAQKHYSGLHTVAMYLYSVFTTGHVFLHHHQHINQNLAGHNHEWYKWTTSRDFLEDGKEPLPIMTAIRPERPRKDWEDKDQPFREPDHSAIEHKVAADAWF